MLTVRCPHCGNPTVFSKENPFRPFCSERCKMIDLGHWASEDFKIPAQEAPHFQEGTEMQESEDSVS